MDPEAFVIVDARAWKPEMATLEQLMAAGVLRRATEPELAMIAADEVPQSWRDELERLAKRMDEARPNILMTLEAPAATVERRVDHRPPWMGKKPWWQR